MTLNGITIITGMILMLGAASTEHLPSIIMLGTLGAGLCFVGMKR